MDWFGFARDTADSITRTVGEADRQIRETAEDADRKIRLAAEETKRQVRIAAEEAERKILIEKEAAERLLRKHTEDAQRLASDVAKSIDETVEEVRKKLKNLIPSFDEKRQQIVDDIVKIASAAAAEGLDIIEAINSAVDIALRKVDRALDAAIKAVDGFLQKAEEVIFQLLGQAMPDGLQWMLDPLKNETQSVLAQLRSFGSQLKEEISMILAQIQQTIRHYIQEADEILGPISKFIKCLWKELFGEEPEQCHIAAQWFEERIKRTEQQLLYRRTAEPVSALIKKYTFLEVLPPHENSWRALALEFLGQAQGIPTRSAHQARMIPVLEETTVKPGNVIQLTWDEPFTDALGGIQRVQISVLYFRWKSEEFRMVSSGFLGILAMVSAVDTQSTPDTEPPSIQISSDPPLLLDPVARKMIYEQIKPCIRVRPMKRFEGPEQRSEMKKGESQQLKYRDDDGVWRSAT